MRFHLSSLSHFLFFVQLSFATAKPANVPTGLLIPLYVYPGVTWSQVASVKTVYPNVPIAAVINPNSGPGITFDPNYLTGIQQLQSANVLVLGYVFTNYGRTPLATVEAQVRAYWSMYHVNGIMFDGMSNQIARKSYYTTLNSYAKSLGMTYTLGNPGTTTKPGYVGSLNATNIYENSAIPTIAAIQAATFSGAYSNSNFAMIAYGV